MQESDRRACVCVRAHSCSRVTRERDELLADLPGHWRGAGRSVNQPLGWGSVVVGGRLGFFGMLNKWTEEGRAKIPLCSRTWRPRRRSLRAKLFVIKEGHGGSVCVCGGGGVYGGAPFFPALKDTIRHRKAAIALDQPAPPKFRRMSKKKKKAISPPYVLAEPVGREKLVFVRRT